MSDGLINNKFLWYAIYTKSKEEERVESNLRAWGVQTFMPRIRERRAPSLFNKPVPLVRHLFPRYIFAQFDADSMLHKVNYTRGVCYVVGFGQGPSPVDDIVIEAMRAQINKEGFIKLGEEINCGDEVMIKTGPFECLQGTVEREMSDNNRLLILLSSVSYQGRLMIEKALVKKTLQTNH